jgi:hypothetical protein
MITGMREESGELAGVLVHLLAWVVFLSAVFLIASVLGIAPVDVARWVLSPWGP